VHFVGLFLSSLLKMHGPKNKSATLSKRSVIHEVVYLIEMRLKFMLKLLLLFHESRIVLYGILH